MYKGWVHRRVEDVCERVSVGIVIQPSQYYTTSPDGVRAFRSANVGENRIIDRDWVFLTPQGHAVNSKSVLRTGDVLVVRSGAPGTSCVVTPEFDGSNCIDIVFARPRQTHVVPEYLAAYTNSDHGRRQVLGHQGGLALKHLNVAAYKRMELNLPPLGEQRKIAEILRTWDHALELLRRRTAQYMKVYRGLLSHSFEVAFREHTGLCLARDLLQPVSERGQTDLPLLAVTQNQGVVRRDELERRVVMPDGDVSTYKAVRPGDFVISLRSFEGGLEYSRVAGLVSPAYTVLRPKVDLDSDYYRHFFKSPSFLGRLNRLIFGIRDGKQIASRDFGDMAVPRPSVLEQEKHAIVFNAAEAAINLSKWEYEALTAQKRGLMQKLLTAEWRVKVD